MLPQVELTTVFFLSSLHPVIVSIMLSLTLFYFFVFMPDFPTGLWHLEESDHVLFAFEKRREEGGEQTLSSTR